MAELDVRPKKSNPWWLWLLLAIILIALVLFLAKGCNNKNSATTTTDSTSTTTTTTDTSGGKQTLAATQPDFSAVDFNSPKSTDPDITDKNIAVSGNGNYTIYTLGENILFATDQSTLQSSADQKLKQISSSLGKRFKGATLAVYGSTDSTGTASTNKQLGAQRAEAVKSWLVKNAGIDSTKISVHSLGESKPVASNATASGRQENRNVSIVAFPNGSGK